MARPVEYSDVVNVKAREWLKTIEEDSTAVPLMETLARVLGIHRETVLEWAKTYPAFSDTYEYLKALYAERLKIKGLESSWNSNIVKLLLSADHGIVETTKSENINRNEEIIPENGSDYNEFLKSKKVKKSNES